MRQELGTAARLFALACAILALAPPNNIANDYNDIPVNGAPPPAELRKLDLSARLLLARWSIPGASIAIVKNGKLIFARGYGFADTAENIPVWPERTLFRIASVSKPITAAAVLKLVEDNKLKLDDRAFDILGPLAPMPGAKIDRRIENVTIRDLLQMSGGWDKEHSGDPILPPYVFRAAKRVHRQGAADFETTMRYVIGHRMDFTPGTRYAYSNFEYGLLGKVIERVAQTDYEKYVRDNIFQPAGVQLYQGHTRSEDRLPNEVVYYAPKEPLARPLLPTGRRQVAAPYSRAYLETDLPILGWVSSAPELAQLVDRLTTDDNLLNKTTRDLMVQRPALPCWNNRRRYFAFGWEVTHDQNGRVSLYKDGTLPGTRAFVEHNSDGLTWVALFNGRPPQKQPDRFCAQVREMMSNGLDYVELVRPATPIPQPVYDVQSFKKAKHQDCLMLKRMLG